MKPEPIPYTVSQLNRNLRNRLENDYSDVIVSGELSNTTRPSSGHLYFTLKDENAQLRCVFFRTLHTHESKRLTDGQQVLARGKLSLYEARGDYQLIVQSLSPAGLGELYQQFIRLKDKLEQQGLFSPLRKKPIPRFPNTIAIITSPTGAALQDMLSTLKRRFPSASVQVYASEVQGKNAALQLSAAIKQANQDKRAEVILLARGGGSLEDLWPFNEEHLALAISQSSIPIISGVGHETDVSIADFVADLRAATPTAAAEAATPDQCDLLKQIDNYECRLHQVISKIFKHQRLMLSHLMSKIAAPEQMMGRLWQGLDFSMHQLQYHMKQTLQNKTHRLELLLSALQATNPEIRWQQTKSQLLALEQQLHLFIAKKLQNQKQSFELLTTLLHAMSPLATLNRGYAIAMHQGRIILDSKEVFLGETLELQLARGRLLCEIKAKEGA